MLTPEKIAELKALKAQATLQEKSDSKMGLLSISLRKCARNYYRSAAVEMRRAIEKGQNSCKVFVGDVEGIFTDGEGLVVTPSWENLQKIVAYIERFKKNDGVTATVQPLLEENLYFMLHISWLHFSLLCPTV